jgi:hypothetical protein
VGLLPFLGNIYNILESRVQNFLNFVACKRKYPSNFALSLLVCCYLVVDCSIRNCFIFCF